MGNQTSDQSTLIAIEVAYAKPADQVVIALQVPTDSTIAQAIALSRLSERFPEIAESELKVGIFGTVCKLDHPVKQGDRVEIYRPLIHDPKEARRNRALKK